MLQKEKIVFTNYKSMLICSEYEDEYDLERELEVSL